MPTDPVPARPPSAGGTPPAVRHDLLNALNAVIGYGTLLEMDVTADPPRQWVLRLLQAAREAQALAESLPSSRGTAG